MRINLIFIFILVLLTNCEQKRTKVFYPFLELESFEYIDSINQKLIEIYDKELSLNYEMGYTSGRFNVDNGARITSECYMEFDSDKNLIWFQVWYRHDNKTDVGTDSLVQWFSDYYKTDTLTDFGEGRVITRSKGNEILQFSNLKDGSNKILYFGQFFTHKFPSEDV